MVLVHINKKLNLLFKCQNVLSKFEVKLFSLFIFSAKFLVCVRQLSEIFLYVKPIKKSGKFWPRKLSTIWSQSEDAKGPSLLNSWRSQFAKEWNRQKRMTTNLINFIVNFIVPKKLDWHLIHSHSTFIVLLISSNSKRKKFVLKWVFM